MRLVLAAIGTTCALLVGGAFPVHADNATGAPSNSSNLARLWTTVFQTPSDQNPFGTGDAQSACISLAKQAIAPFAPAGVTSCSVAAGTSIFVTASSVECSTFEGNGNTKAELRSCAIAGDAQTAPTVTVDGAPVTVGGTESGLMRIVLPTNNIFGLPSGKSSSPSAPTHPSRQRSRSNSPSGSTNLERPPLGCRGTVRKDGGPPLLGARLDAAVVWAAARGRSSHLGMRCLGVLFGRHHHKEG
jgi:hypothetical protein